MKRGFLLHVCLMLMIFLAFPYADVQPLTLLDDPNITGSQLNVISPSPSISNVIGHAPSKATVHPDSRPDMIGVDSPEITSPADIVYEAGETGHELTWILSNCTPTSYELSRNETLLERADWPGGDNLTISVDNLHPAFYNYSLTVYYNITKTLQDSVSVIVLDTTSPVLSSPQDIEYEAKTSGNSITWSVFDLYPDSFEIYRDDVLLHSAYWDDEISISIDLLNPGTYNYSIFVYDDFDNHNEDSVTVEVIDTKSPVLSQPSNITFIEGEIGHTITWVGSDFYPSSYAIYRDGALVETGQWSLASNQIVISLDNLTEDVYIYRIELYDTSGNSISDEVEVTVLSPIIPLIPFLLLIAAASLVTISSLWFFKLRRKVEETEKAEEVEESGETKEVEDSEDSEEESLSEEDEVLDDDRPITRPAPEEVTQALIEESKRIPERVREESLRRMEELDGSDEPD